MNTTRDDIVKALVEGGQNPALARKMLEAVLEVLSAKMRTSPTITLRGFGTFIMKLRKPHPARNPRTGELIPVPEHYTVFFRPSAQLKRNVNDR